MEEEKAEPRQVDAIVMLDTLSYLAYHLYTLDALSRCTYPLRWSVLRHDIREDFYARAEAAYKDWHASEIDSIEARRDRYGIDWRKCKCGWTGKPAETIPESRRREDEGGEWSSFVVQLCPKCRKATSYDKDKSVRA